jgi:nitroreductase
MNTSNAFRSHLMQQFATAARAQSRPPLAMIGWLKETDAESHTQRFSTTTSHSNDDSRRSSRGQTSSSTTTAAAVPQSSVLSSPSRDLSSIGTSILTHSPSQDASSRSQYAELRLPSLSSSSSRKEPPDLRRLFSTYTVSDQESDNRDLVSGNASRSDNAPPPAAVEAAGQVAGDNHNHDLPVAFQTMLQTRRTSSHFAPRLSPSSTSSSNEQAQVKMPTQTQEHEYWRGALERAVICGSHAPNHKRTEPFTFKRMVSPSEKTERLAEIAYHVSVREQQQMISKTGASPEQIEEKALKRRDKWSRIPAFLVTLLTSESIVADPDVVESLDDVYEQLPYSAPATERELEDYAAASSAVQNVLLSLHSEQIASKWVTGPVIRTPAFRELVQASPHDRIVSLVMIGHADESKRLHPHRRRRALHGDVLVDL